MRVIDSHAHLHLHNGSATKLIALMSHLGIHKTVVVAGGVVTPRMLSDAFLNGGNQSVDVDNMEVMKRCLPSGGRLLPFFFANPHSGALSYRKIGRTFYGLKFAPIVHGVPLMDERMAPFLELAEKYNHVTYLHCLPRQGFDVPDLVRLAREFPRNPLILGHAGVGNADFRAVDLVKPYPNILFETSGGFSAVIETAVRELGASRVLFGSEYPLQHPKLELEKLRLLGLSESELKQIMGQNIGDLIGEGGGQAL